jgi:guanine deaminase
MADVTLFRAQILSPKSADAFVFHRAGGLVVNSEGKIVAVADYKKVKQDYPQALVIDLSDRLIIPGFIDTHVHLPQYKAVAIYGRELLGWLENYIYPAERDFTPEVAQELAPVFFTALLAHGVTAAAVYCSVQMASTHVAFESAEKVGIRVAMGKVMMDQNSPEFLLENTSDSIKGSEELCRRWHGADQGRLLYSFIPRFAPTCSRKLMATVGEMAKQYGAYIQTHIAENPKEVDWVKELFPEAQSYADVYSRAGLLGPRTVLAHAIYLSEQERLLLKKTKTCLAHCPTSNLFLQSGFMPLRELMDRGLTIGLGSDVGGGPTLSPFEVMRAALYVHTTRRLLLGAQGEITPATAFYLSTWGGAKTLGLGEKIGTLEAGKEADFVVVNPAQLNPLRGKASAEETPENLLSRLIFRGDDRVVEQSYVRGRLCYDKYSDPVPR